MGRRRPPHADRTKIRVSAGNGGSGCVSFAKRAGGLKLGPDGGHGGSGGNVWLVASQQLTTLNRLQRNEYKAENGTPGLSQKKTGGMGKDLEIKVPPGTEIYELTEEDDGNKQPTSSRWLGCLLFPNEKILVAKGGKRGLGNIAFVSPSNQRPQRAVPGGQGEKRLLELQLRRLAHVGLAGWPNSGKSTLLGALSRAKPKVAPYPFTTLHPQLGVMDIDDNHDSRWVIADVPGLLPDASDGRGLGFDFLFHLEKTALILIVVASDGPQDLLQQKDVITRNLSAYSDELGRKKTLLFISKSDRLTSQRKKEIVSHLIEQNIPHLIGSAKTGEGIPELKNHLHHHLMQIDDLVKTPSPFDDRLKKSHSNQQQNGHQFIQELLTPHPIVTYQPLTQDDSH